MQVDAHRSKLFMYVAAIHICLYLTAYSVENRWIRGERYHLHICSGQSTLGDSRLDSKSLKDSVIYEAVITKWLEQEQEISQPRRIDARTFCHVTLAAVDLDHVCCTNCFIISWRCLVLCYPFLHQQISVDSGACQLQFEHQRAYTYFCTVCPNVV